MTGHVDILMYHSISDRGGPTSILPETFAAQMAALASSDRQVVGIDALATENWPDNSVVITFDDAFQDFVTSAWPILEQRGFPAVVYVPTDHVANEEDWAGALTPPRRLMDWADIRLLANEGVTFGSHSVSHPDLTALEDSVLMTEITRSKEVLEAELGTAVRHFAPPYGRSSPKVRKLIAQNYSTSVGTRLARAGPSSDRFDLPRIEMFYYSNMAAWYRHLSGRGTPYLNIRKGLRTVRNLLSHPASRA
ncbi:MAG: polysaccharide deacetylase family protein [Silicimonas sp.]|nr:polysaccharide deacetylase family protein [Silicimonas sp.]